MGRLFSYATPGDGSLYALGVLAAGLTGVARGFFGLLMMRSITALAPSNPDTLYQGGLLWSLVFLGVGAAVLVLNTVRAAAPQSCSAAAPRNSAPPSPLPLPLPSPGELELPHRHGRAADHEPAPRAAHQAAALRG